MRDGDRKRCGGVRKEEWFDDDDGGGAGAPRLRPPPVAWKKRNEEDEGWRVGGRVQMKKEMEGVGIYIYMWVKITTKYPIIHSELYF